MRSTTTPIATRPSASAAQNSVEAPAAIAGVAPRDSTSTVAAHCPALASTPASRKNTTISRRTIGCRNADSAGSGGASAPAPSCQRARVAAKATASTASTTPTAA